MGSFRGFRGAGELRRRQRGGGRYNGKLPVIQRRVVTAKEEERNGRYNGKLPVLQRRVVTGKEEERRRPIQWKVTGDSEARGNCEGGREAAADTMESYRRFRGAW